MEEIMEILMNNCLVASIVGSIIGIVVGCVNNRALRARILRLEELVMHLVADRRGSEREQQPSEEESAIEEKPSPEKDTQDPWWVWILVVLVVIWMALEYFLWKPMVFIGRKLFRRAD